MGKGDKAGALEANTLLPGYHGGKKIKRVANLVRKTGADAHRKSYHSGSQWAKSARETISKFAGGQHRARSQPGESDGPETL